ncbi:hypothetical protein OKW98_05145 [Pseudomonas sp. KU26590]|uniref:hypothetical protein n=1 Tax=Pseudomonas sp. KU26590 TaxID=2991051 RepID=UPI00223CF3E1|nr:hypothetical protein [Pseudomonas sp. KU26590]UZJ61117.1 hypothetical protein OKW98_05145 [Pseudomonas sp. KU26590]
MKNKLELQRIHLLLGFCILSFLTFWFARYIQTSSFDLVQHLLLVDELSRYGSVQPGAFERIGAMALYPPAAHWMAVVIGWIGGSGLVGISIVSIVSLYLCYVLIIGLVGVGSITRALLITAAFLGLMFTHSLIGWEIVENYFYPQLVADAFYFGALYWAVNNREGWKQTATFLLAGYATMWVQPLVAVHILAAGCALMAFPLWTDWGKGKTTRRANAVCLLIMIVGAILIVFTNPAFRVMRQIASNDGYLVFGYPAAMPVALICGAIGAWNLRRYWNGKGEYTDVVLGSAVVAAVGLVILQFALLKLHGDGSDYAIKKHMFIVVTLGMMNVVRVIASNWSAEKSLAPGLVTPVLAGLASIFALQGYTTPVGPIVRALNYADHLVQFQLPNFVPGSTVSDDTTLPLMGNVMVSLTAFQHPFDARAISWLRGASIKDGAGYVMVRRTSYIDTICDSKLANSGGLVVVDPSCLHTYIPGEQLSFAVGGNSWQYIAGGWSNTEAWGAWSLGDVEGVIQLNVPISSYQLIVDGRAYLNAQHPSQTIVVEANGTEIAKWQFSLAEPAGSRSADIPKGLIKDGSLRVALKAPGSVSPKELGQSEDARVIGLGVKTMVLRAIP